MRITPRVCTSVLSLYYSFFWWYNKKKIVQELLDSPSVSQSSKDVIEDAGIDKNPVFDQSLECQASIEVGVQVKVSIRNVGIYTQVVPKSIEKGIVRI